MIWFDYSSGPDAPYPLLYVLPVCVAAWFSGQRAALALALGLPLSHAVLQTVVWDTALGASNLVTFVLRTVGVAAIGAVFAKQAEYERQLREELQRRHAVQLRAEQLRVVHVTMRSVEDIVNNCLNQLLLLRIEAEGLVPAASLSTFDDAVREASAKLKALAELQAFAEKQMEIGMGLDPAGARAPTVADAPITASIASVR